MTVLCKLFFPTDKATLSIFSNFEIDWGEHMCFACNFLNQILGRHIITMGLIPLVKMNALPWGATQFLRAPLSNTNHSYLCDLFCSTLFIMGFDLCICSLCGLFHLSFPWLNVSNLQVHGPYPSVTLDHEEDDDNDSYMCAENGDDEDNGRHVPSGACISLPFLVA